MLLQKTRDMSVDYMCVCMHIFNIRCHWSDFIQTSDCIRGQAETRSYHYQSSPIRSRQPQCHRRSRPWDIPWEWCLYEVSRRQDCVVLFCSTASTAEHPSVSVHNRPPVLGVVSCPPSTTVMQLWPAYHRIFCHDSSQWWTPLLGSSFPLRGSTTSLRSFASSTGWRLQSRLHPSVPSSHTNASTGLHLRTSSMNCVVADVEAHQRLRSASSSRGPHSTIHHRGPSLSGCRCSYLEQFTPARHFCTFVDCLPVTPQDSRVIFIIFILVPIPVPDNAQCSRSDTCHFEHFILTYLLTIQI